MQFVPLLLAQDVLLQLVVICRCNHHVVHLDHEVQGDAVQDHLKHVRCMIQQVQATPTHRAVTQHVVYTPEDDWTRSDEVGYVVHLLQI